MNWSNFQEEAFNITRKEVRMLNKQVLDEYRKAIKDIEQRLEKVYSKILQGVSPEDYYNVMIKRNRLEKLIKDIREKYTVSSKKAGVLTRIIASLSFSNTYYRRAYNMQWLEPKYKVKAIPKSLLELSILGTSKAWEKITESIQNKFGDKKIYIPRVGTLSSLLSNNRAKEIAQIQSAIAQAIINGDSRRDMHKVIQNIIGRELKKDGKIALTGAKASASRIIRTETNRIMNLGAYAQAFEASSQGVNVKRELASVLDNRTRAQSASMDGQRREINKPFTYPGGIKAMTPGTTGVKKYDINDRETVITIVNDESPQIRTGRNPETGENEVFEYKSFGDWAKEQGLKKNIYGEYYK